MTPVLSGVAAGLLGAVAASRLLSSQVFGIGTGDPLTFFVAGVFMLLVSLAASYLAALRATRIEPSQVLRAE